jgi:type II restriction enzyme
LKEIPVDGKIPIIKERKIFNPETVRQSYDRFRFLSEKKYDMRGWTADVLKFVRELGKKDFTLDEAYSFDRQLQLLHPDNKNIRPKTCLPAGRSVNSYKSSETGGFWSLRAKERIALNSP